MRSFSFRLNLPPAGLGTTEGGFVWSSAGLNASPPRWGGQRVRAERGVRGRGNDFEGVCFTTSEVSFGS
ncbi:MAG: hypothetical protein ACTS4Y_01375 [Candidatus Hodgkinia cicadicola]